MKSRSKTFRSDIIAILIFCFVSVFSFQLSAQPKPGDLFPAWKQGYLEIHHINTGKGEASFYIMPDGTTMLVDAGATVRPKPRVTDQRPDSTRTPGEWISRYILHMMKDVKQKKLDYILLTHFHGDHMGELKPGLKTSASGGYKLTGVTEAGDMIPFSKIVDRGFPDYNFPRELNDENTKNYLQFQKWHINNKGARAEQFKVGQNKQFILVNNPDKYPDFEVRNIAANGHVWTGFGTNERNHFPPMESLTSSQLPDENKCSIAFRVSYGKFDYFNGGDITTGNTGQWQDIETPVGMVTGPVEICETNHHAYYDAMGLPFIQAVRPQVFIIQSWSPSHPSPGPLSRMQSTSSYPGPRDIYCTNMMDETRVVIGSSLDNFKSQQGHIVVSVEPGGRSYTIYILDDSNEKYLIKSIHGPYICN